MTILISIGIFIGLLFVIGLPDICRYAEENNNLLADLINIVLFLITLCGFILVIVGITYCVYKMRGGW